MNPVSNAHPNNMKSCFHEALVKENKGFTNHPIPRRYGYVLDVEWQHWSRWGRSHVFSCQSRAEKRWREHSMQSLVSTLKNCMGILSTISKKSLWEPGDVLSIISWKGWVFWSPKRKSLDTDDVNVDGPRCWSISITPSKQLARSPHDWKQKFPSSQIWIQVVLRCINLNHQSASLSTGYDCALTWEMEVASI